MLAQARGRLAHGGAVLMHDALGPGARRADCENTVELLAPLIAEARAVAASMPARVTDSAATVAVSDAPANRCGRDERSALARAGCIGAARQRSRLAALASTLEPIARRAAALDASPRFPGENFEALAAAGVLQCRPSASAAICGSRQRSCAP